MNKRLGSMNPWVDPCDEIHQRVNFLKKLIKADISQRGNLSRENKRLNDEVERVRRQLLKLRCYH